MKNQECYDKDGAFLGWFSRAVAVVMTTFGRDVDGNLYVLASQRGPGTPDPEYVGMWNVCCGYLDFDETTKEAARRETFEETGIDVPDYCVEMVAFKDDPKQDKRQNVSVRFCAVLPQTIDKYTFSHEHNEKNEVGMIRWIPVRDIDGYRWAFGHDALIAEMTEYVTHVVIFKKK